MRCAIGLLIAMLVFVPGCGRAVDGTVSPFSFDGSRLVITTSTLEMTVQFGSVVGLRNTATGEAFTLPYPPLDVCPDVGATVVVDSAGTRVNRAPSLLSPVQFVQESGTSGVLTYRGLTNAPVDDELRLRFRVEADGRVAFQLEYQAKDTTNPVAEVRLPFTALDSKAVIAGSGTRFARSDPAGVEDCVRTANLIYNPVVGVVEGTSGSVGLWPEPDFIGYDDLFVRHERGGDVVIPKVTVPRNCKDPSTLNTPGNLKSSWWYAAAVPSWLEVAKAYRASFERRTGAKPLWQQDPQWVRSIHAVTTSRPSAIDQPTADAFYWPLSQRIDPKKLLLFYWNGDRLVMLGDHRFLPDIQIPTNIEIASLKRWGFNWIGYHPYTLIYSPKGMPARYDYIAQRGWRLPDGYVFTPDYAGEPNGQAFTDYFRPVSTGYYANLDDSTGLWVLHPGAQIVRDYLSRNIGDFCAQYQMNGCYLDIAGGECGDMFKSYSPTDLRIVEGRDWRHGELGAFQQVKRDNPGLALMSEGQGEWITSQVFYTWEGATHITHPTPVRVNHPLRTACWGSYTWTQGDGETLTPLMGCLPNVEMDDDWTFARAKLYCDEELFHDLPDKWDPAALAYFRSKSGRWFQYRSMPWGEAYYEETPSGLKSRLGFFTGRTKCPISLPVMIPNWVAYGRGKPIGLAENRLYRFVSEQPTPCMPFVITSLPPGVFISGVRHADKYSVVEFGSISPGPIKVTVTFLRTSVGVSDGQTDHNNVYLGRNTAEFTTQAPGGLVFKWAQPTPVPLTTTASFIGNKGHEQADGTPYTRWTQNSDVYFTSAATFGGQTEQAVILGPGLHRGYTEQWTTLAAGAQPVLKFRAGYLLPSAGIKSNPLMWSVSVNGRRVWNEIVQPNANWRDRQVSLAAYAGRKVLVTLSVEELLTRNARVTTQDREARFGRIRITNNPNPETP